MVWFYVFNNMVWFLVWVLEEEEEEEEEEKEEGEE